MGTAVAIAPRARQSELTAELKRYVAEFDALTTKVGKLQAHVYAASYEWVQICATEGKITPNAAIVRLANTLKRNVSGIKSWYYCGAFMAEHKLNAATCDHRSIYAVFRRGAVLSPYELRRCLEKVRKGDPFEDVNRIVTRSTSAAFVAAERKAESLSKSGTLNRTRLRMEMVALQTLARKLYGADDIGIQVLRSGKVVESV